MTDTTNQETQQTPTRTSGRARKPAQPGAMAQLETEHGVTTISDTVVSKIAALAAREVDGVGRLSSGLSGAISSAVGRIRGSEHDSSGVGVEVGTRQAAVDVSMTVHYPASIHEVAESVRQNVIGRIQSLTGLEVVEVNIAVTDLEFPGGEDQPEPEPRVQ